MSRLDTKKVLVEDLNKIAQEAFSVIAVDYRGTNVPGLTQLRKEAKSQSVQLKVIKNTLAKRALENTKFDSLNEILTGPTLLAFSMNDFQSAAKLVKDFAAKGESFEVKGLSIGEGFLEPNELKALASLPSKEDKTKNSQLIIVCFAEFGIFRSIPNQHLIIFNDHFQ